MKACFDDITALELWRRDPQYWSTLRSVYYKPLPNDMATTSGELRSLSILPELFPDGYVHLLTFNSSDRNSIPGYRFRRTESLPPESLRRLNDELLVPSPELVFVRLANHLDTAELVEIGMELCGKYALVPEAPHGYVPRSSSLTTASKIADYLDKAKGMHGIKAARTALKHVRDGAESPMETRQYMYLCMPPRMGSYGLTEVVVNGVLRLNEAAQALARCASFRCDLLLKNKQTGILVAVEYDSKERHTGLAAFYRDNTKRNILLDMGVKVFVVSSAQILDVEQFDAIAHMVARAVGKRLRDFPEDWEARRDALRRATLKSMSQPRNPFPQQPFFE